MTGILLRSLAVTLLIETLAALLLGLRRRHALTVVWLMNLVTNPPVVFAVTLCRKLWPVYAPPVTALCEVLAVAAEYVLLRRCVPLSRRRAAVAAVVLNLASYLAGCLLSV
ncbi:hypothetical protein RWV98_01395 [Agathobaculum sp. NTUH-O15-33]|uniref:hypothetical protein n=1 Tax=Agathobaculum sp. NTUH-O15-33 TaxID=3079302 RepID=UPI002958CB90|nr:hypothetical protein [Agathobaculum sp. NTUH-O15-33]WNX84955.1 hypothetical protein RWV98_01395 [Agathobaculum sp. NTUH-O15-33]